MKSTLTALWTKIRVLAKTNLLKTWMEPKRYIELRQFGRTFRGRVIGEGDGYWNVKFKKSVPFYGTGSAGMWSVPKSDDTITRIYWE